MPVAMQAAVGGGFRPEPKGHWHPHRFQAVELAARLGLRRGDVACRLGNAVARHELSIGGILDGIVERIGLPTPVKAYTEIPFSPLIARVSGSEYSHASLVWDERSLDILDVGSEGTRVVRLLDWLDDVRGSSVVFLRHRENIWGTRLLNDAMDSVANRDPDFDADFAPGTDRLYCCEVVYVVYAAAGVDLGPPVRFRDLPGWDWKMEIMAAIGNIRPDTPVYTVGNSEHGLLASPHLTRVGKLVLTESGVKLE